MIAGTGIEVTPGCSAMPTRCSGTGYTNYGIREYIYQGTVTLAPCNSWTMSYTSGSRNPITTVPNNSSNNWYVMAMLNNLQAPCNSSPTFSNRPIGVVCTNQLSCFNHGAVDINNDSLVYSFYSPFTTGPTATVTYAWPYTYTNFLQSSTPITIDPVTGDICFTPTVNLITLTGVKVEEYRKINNIYVLIGTVYRDLQLKVDYCNNTIPILSGMDTLNTHTYSPNDSTYWMETCYVPGKVISFDINGYDADTFNITTTGNPEKFSITWNNGIPQGSFQAHYNNTDSAYAHFSWALQASDINNLPKCFTATVKDQACPYFGSQTFSYCITVRGMTVKMGSDTLLCSGESVKYTAIGDTTTKNYVWTLDGISTGTPLTQNNYTFNSIGKNPGIYKVVVETNEGGTTVKCPGHAEAIITLVYQPHINGTLNDSTVCKPGSITYDAGPGTTYLWTDLLNQPQGTTQNLSITNSGIYFVYVDGGVQTRCNDIDTFRVYAIESPNLGQDTCLWVPSVTLHGGLIESGLEYLWSDGSTDSILDVTQSGTYTLSLYHPLINSSLKCSDSKVVNLLDQNEFIKSIRIQVDNSPLEGELDSTGDRTICNHQKLKIFGPNPPSGHNYIYSWYQDGQLMSSTPYYIFKEKVPNTYLVTLNVEAGCTQNINVTTDYCAVIPPNVITPGDNNGINDVFNIKGLENYPSSTLLIYNRWGKKVYQSENYQNDWDGDNCADGVYFWVLKVADGEGTEYQGNLTILRK